MFSCLVLSYIAYLLEWNWVAAIFLLGAIGNLIPEKKTKKKKRKQKPNTKDTGINIKIVD